MDSREEEAKIWQPSEWMACVISSPVLDVVDLNAILSMKWLTPEVEGVS